MNRCSSTAGVILLTTAVAACAPAGSAAPSPASTAAAPSASAAAAATAAPTTAPTAAADGSAAPVPGAAPIAGTHVALVPPAGFVIATTFPGFQHDATGSSILVAELPGPYGAMADGMTDERFASQGVEVTSRTDVTIDGRPGLLLEGRQESGGVTFGKVLLITGTEELSAIVNGSYPIDEASIGAAMRAAILSASFDPDRPTDALAALPFTFAPAPPLELAGVFGNGATYVEAGAVDAAGPSMVVAPSLGTPDIADLEAFARQALGQTATLTDVVVESASDVTIAGLPGIVLVGTANKTTRDGQLLVYQVLLSDGSGYVRILGMCPIERRAECLEMFEQSAATYRPKP